MDIKTAHAAAVTAAQIDRVQALLVQVDLVIAENWPLTIIRATAPAEGASQPGGTQVDLLPGGVASPEAWKLAVSAARTAYQAQLDQLNADLGKL